MESSSDEEREPLIAGNEGINSYSDRYVLLYHTLASYFFKYSHWYFI